METEIQQKTRAYVTDFLTRTFAPAQAYHHIRQTEAMVQAAEEIGKGNLLDDQAMEIVILAAWLHDLGDGLPAQEQEKGRQKAMDFLSSQGISSPVLERVARCIKAIQTSPTPANVLEGTLFDARTCAMASDQFFEQAALFRKAQNGQQDREISEQAWLSKTLHFLQQHIFFTDYAKKTFTTGKEKNVQLLQEKLQTWNSHHNVVALLTEENEKLKRKLAKKEQKAGRGIETLFRNTMASHLKLSAMADTKANLMISVNAIIVSIMVASFVRKFDEIPNLVVPTILLTIVCLLTIVFAVLSTRPTINLKKNDPETSDKKGVDLLFFGDFTKLSASSYKKSFQEMMRNQDLLYGSMIDGFYAQGKVLKRKYHLLKIAYTIFIVGFAVVVLSYILALLR